MPKKIVDLSLAVEDDMSAHKLFQPPVITTRLSHESTKSMGLGIPGDASRFRQTLLPC